MIKPRKSDDTLLPIVTKQPANNRKGQRLRFQTRSPPSKPPTNPGGLTLVPRCPYVGSLGQSPWTHSLSFMFTMPSGAWREQNSLDLLPRMPYRAIDSQSPSSGLLKRQNFCPTSDMSIAACWPQKSRLPEPLTPWDARFKQPFTVHFLRCTSTMSLSACAAQYSRLLLPLSPYVGYFPHPSRAQTVQLMTLIMSDCAWRMQKSPPSVLPGRARLATAWQSGMTHRGPFIDLCVFWLLLASLVVVRVCPLLGRSSRGDFLPEKRTNERKNELI